MPVAAANYQDGGSIAGFYPALQSLVLGSVAAATGVTPPVNLNPSIVVMTGRTMPLIPANPGRTFLLIYNPTQAGAEFSKGTASRGAIGNLGIGPGQYYFWANAQGLAPVYQGALTAIGRYPGLPLWTWEDSTNLYNDGGTLAFVTTPIGWPTSFVGLPAGALWNDDLTIGIVPGLPFLGPAVFFQDVSATSLLNLTGASFPTTPPAVGSGQLWNNGGSLSVA